MPVARASHRGPLASLFGPLNIVWGFGAVVCIILAADLSVIGMAGVIYIGVIIACLFLIDLAPSDRSEVMKIENAP